MIELDLNQSYDQHFKQRLDDIHPDLLTNPAVVETLAPAQQDALIDYCLRAACQAQHVRNITLGRAGLTALPRSWLLERIEAVADPILAAEDAWEYRRLLEVYELLDRSLFNRLIDYGLQSHDPEMREASQDAAARAQ